MLSFLSCCTVFALVCVAGCASNAPHLPDALRVSTDRPEDWHVELEAGGTVDIADGVIEIDVPAGASVWLRHRLEGPVQIDYDAVAISAGGPNDRVSDLNCFWMASDARNEADFFAVQRSGRFADYNQLKCYYVGLGGNANTTTRFRRYVGSPTTRPLLPEHDLQAPEHLLKPNVVQHIRLIADGPRIEYQRDGVTLFSFHDDAPYTGGYFALRTVTSHLRITNLRIGRPTSTR